MNENFKVEYGKVMQTINSIINLAQGVEDKKTRCRRSLGLEGVKRSVVTCVTTLRLPFGADVRRRL